MSRTGQAPALLSAAEAARLLSVDVKTVHRWARSGRLQSFAKMPGVSGAFVFEPDEVERVRVEQLTEARERVKVLSKASVAAMAALALLAGPTLSTDGHGPIAPSSTDGHQGERGLDLDAASS